MSTPAAETTPAAKAATPVVARDPDHENLMQVSGFNIFGIAVAAREGAPIGGRCYQEYVLAWKRQIYQEDQQLAVWAANESVYDAHMDRLYRQEMQLRSVGAYDRASIARAAYDQCRTTRERGKSGTWARRAFVDQLRTVQTSVYVRHGFQADEEKAPRQGIDIEAARQILVEMDAMQAAHEERFRTLDVTTATPEQMCERIYYTGFIEALVRRHRKALTPQRVPPPTATPTSAE